jgi:DNA repair exonuclease SbcCD ATPase subunit
MNTLELRHLLPGLALIGLVHAPLAEARVYCCKDARGYQVCGDVLPESCADRSYRELNYRGVTVKQVDAPISAEQRAKRDAAALKADEEDRARQEQRRRDATLLNTYSSEHDIDIARKRRVSDIEELLSQLRGQEQTLKQRQVKMEADAARFVGRPVPSGIKDRLDSNAQDMRLLAENIASKERDLLDTEQRFKEDLERFRQLSGQR